MPVTPQTRGAQLAPNAKTQARADPTEPFATSACSHTQSRNQTSISRLKTKPSAGKALSTDLKRNSYSQEII
uniref:Putative ovule protein n=1 Tax=Solanum chacoense TaxID=4108 RepID=A0A0V0IFH2_SOLCH